MFLKYEYITFKKVVFLNSCRTKPVLSQSKQITVKVSREGNFSFYEIIYRDTPLKRNPTLLINFSGNNFVHRDVVCCVPRDPVGDCVRHYLHACPSPSTNNQSAD